MKRFWLFRSNLKSLEYYHKYTDLYEFKENCHDYYLLLPMWLLEKGYFDEVTIWRLTDKERNPIIFDIDGKKYIQRWCKRFEETLNYGQPDISFFRGGFKEYDEVTNRYPEKFGKKLYLGAGQRINTTWNGKYDVILMEDDLDLKNNKYTIPFYKTASPFIFHQIQNKIIDMHWDICWPCNFTQLSYKGQEFFIREVAKSEMLRKLKIAHCGNKPEVGKKLCKQYGVKNIEFLGLQERSELNKVLNSSRFGLNLSNRKDGCPRVSTEILMSCTPLIIHEQTRLLSYYKQKGVIEVNDKNIANRIINAIDDSTKYKAEVYNAIENELSFDNTNQKNIDLWLR